MRRSTLSHSLTHSLILHALVAQTPSDKAAVPPPPHPQHAHRPHARPHACTPHKRMRARTCTRARTPRRRCSRSRRSWPTRRPSAAPAPPARFASRWTAPPSPPVPRPRVRRPPAPSLHTHTRTQRIQHVVLSPPLPLPPYALTHPHERACVRACVRGCSPAHTRMRMCSPPVCLCVCVCVCLTVYVYVCVYNAYSVLN